MKVVVYKEIVNFINNFCGADQECITLLAEKYIDVKETTLYSIMALNGRRKTTQNHRKVKENISDIIKKVFHNTFSNEPSEGIIIKLAKEYNIHPTPMSRLILEHIAKEDNSRKKCITEKLRDTTQITNMCLAHKIFLAVVSDGVYAPSTELIKNLIGKEYEYHLEELIKSIGLVYKTEKNLRTLGYDKTPDILLEIPISVDGFIVNWVESKALFADEINHKQYTFEQYDSYFNRFGTGLVIYWFGFLDIIKKNDKFLIKDNLEASDITQFKPESIPVMFNGFGEISSSVSGPR